MTVDGRICAALLLPGLLLFPRVPDRESSGTLTVTGLQFENTSPATMLAGLDRALAQFPDTQLFVLPEYSFQGPVPEEIAAWCRTRRKWLIAGGTKHVTIPPQDGKGPRKKAESSTDTPAVKSDSGAESKPADSGEKTTESKPEKKSKKGSK